MAMLSSDQRANLFVAILCVVATLSFIGSRDIEEIRERRLAGTAADVYDRGHWLLPELQGAPRYLKPPYADWFAVASMKLFGRNEFGFRLPFALAGLGMIAVSFALARRMFGPQTARAAALILATTPYFVSECHSPSQDLWLGFFAGAALLSWWRWQEEGRPWSRAWWAFWLSTALACLFKGPLALAIVGIPVVIELRASRRWKLGLQMRPWWGLLIVFALALPWPLAVWSQYPDYPARLWADMKISLVKDETKHGFSYLNHLINWPWFTFPWSALGLGALLLPLWRRALPDWPRLRFCYGWLIGNFALFATWAMQPMHYLLPVVPAVAVIEAALLRRLIEAIQQRTTDRRLETVPTGAIGTVGQCDAKHVAERASVRSVPSERWRVRLHNGQFQLHLVAALLAFCFAGFAIATAVFLHVRGSASVAISVAAAICLLVPIVIGAPRLFTGPDSAIGLYIAAGTMCVVTISGWIEPAVSARKSIACFGRELANLVPLREPVYFTDTKDALPFYAPREFRRLAVADARSLADQLAGKPEGYLLLARYRFDGAEPLLRERFTLHVVLQQKKPKDSASDLLLVRFRIRQA
ncbi:MAG: glycosyltransferase family 39 protein [Verrucomicrobia bacterium]|nr:glycosyltransferase family 39 protein [Verrucomicrobiota bacterium]